MSIWLLWLLIVALPGMDSMLSGLSFLMAMVSLCGGFGLVAYGVHAHEHGSDDDKRLFGSAMKYFCAAPALWFLVCIANVVVPDRDQIVYLMGGYFATNIDGIEKLPPNLVKSANKFLEAYATEDDK